MIDLWYVASNSLWIAGLSLLLAAISWASWRASAGKTRIAAALTQPGARRAWAFGIALFCAGMAVTGRVWWEQGLWGTLAAGSIVYALGACTGRAQDQKGKTP
jgi:hypothetical protein